jgi:hypothetical protein
MISDFLTEKCYTKAVNKIANLIGRSVQQIVGISRLKEERRRIKN